MVPKQIMNFTTNTTRKSRFSSISIAGDWGAALHHDTNTSYGYGTHHQRNLVDPLEVPISFWIKEIKFASEIEINGEIVGGSGQLSSTKREHTPNTNSYYLSYNEKE